MPNHYRLLKSFINISIVRFTQIRSATNTTLNRSKSFRDVKPANLNPSKFSPSIKRFVDRNRTVRGDDDPKWAVIAYNLSDEFKIEKVGSLLDKLSECQVIKLPPDIQEDAVALRLISNEPDDSKLKQPLRDIFLFRDGSIVFWGVPYNDQKRFLYSLSSLKINPNDSDLIQEEKEHINYTLEDNIDKSRLQGDEIQIASNNDHDNVLLDKFAFSHAVALSVKLGIWEMMLDEYIESVEWITENMKSGKAIKLSRDQVFRKTGEILNLKHSINLGSDLLDLPDVYWDRSDQEAIFSSLFAYLNIRRRTNVINEKLNNCCELMNLLSSHMNDRHHIRLEWMIIALITVEVLFEILRFTNKG